MHKDTAVFAHLFKSVKTNDGDITSGEIIKSIGKMEACFE